MQKRIFRNTNPWREISKRVPLDSEGVKELKDAVQDQDPDPSEGAPFQERAGVKETYVSMKKKR